MSTLPLLFGERYRRHSIAQRPQKVGGMFSLNLGQLQGPFLDKDFHLQNKKSIGILTSRSFSRRSSLDTARVGSATYTNFNQHLAFIPQEIFQNDEIQNFRTESQTIKQEINVCYQQLNQIATEQTNLAKEIASLQLKLEKDLSEAEQQMISGFKELRSRLFEFSRAGNNTHLAVVKRETSSFKQVMDCMQAHYLSAEQRLSTLETEFKGRETNI